MLRSVKICVHACLRAITRTSQRICSAYCLPGPVARKYRNNPAWKPECSARYKIVLKRPLEKIQRQACMNTNDENLQVFGIRVSAEASDPFTDLVGEDWNTTHWFTTQPERDRAIKDMQREHEYSRRGDKPTLVFEAVTRSTKS